MEPEKLGEPMQKVSDRRRSCYFWKKGACLVSGETDEEKWLLDGRLTRKVSLRRAWFLVFVSLYRRGSTPG